MEIDEAATLQMQYLAEGARKALGAELMAMIPVMAMDTGRKEQALVFTVSREEIGGKALTIATASLLLGAADGTLKACTEGKLGLQIVEIETGKVVPWDGGPLEI